MKKLLLRLIKLLIPISVLLSHAAAQCDKPVIMSEAATVCPGGQTTLHTKPIPGATYQWSDGGPDAASRPAGAGAYVVTVMYASCSETSDTVIIKEKIRPAVIPSKAPSICPGESITLYADTGNYWLRKADLPAAGRTSAIGISIGSKGYTGTGVIESSGTLFSDWWEYDEATEVWTQKADVPGAARMNGVGFALNNKGYAGLGFNMSSTQYKDFYEYDPFTNQWTAKAVFPGAAALATASFAIGSRGYVGTGLAPFTGTSEKFWSYDPGPDQWAPIADFPGTRRLYAIGFTLNNKGYVTTGSQDLTTFLNDCWQYDPVTNSWNPQAPLPGTPRTYATAFTIGNHAYVVGGTTNTGDVNEIWEFYNGAWTKKTDFPDGSRSRMTSFGFHDKGIVLFGTSLSGRVYEYNPNNTLEWPDGSTGTSFTVNMPGTYSAIFHDVEGCATASTPLTVTAQSPPTAITLSGNDTICAGDSATLSAAGDSWTQMNNFSTATWYGTSFALGAAGYFAGGSPDTRQFHRYDPATDSWSQLPDLPMTVASTVAVIWQGKAWLYGSSDKAIWMYNPVTGAWVRKATCPGPARNVIEGFLLGDQIIIAGGVTSSGSVSTKEVWAYDLNNDSWTRKNDLPYFIGYAASFAINGKGYLCTGNSSRGAPTGTPQSAVFLEYDPLTDSWTELPDFPGGARGAGVAFTDGHKAYVGLGNHGANLTDIWQFDPVSKTWARMADIPVGRYATTAFVLGNHAYVATGARLGSSTRLNDVWQYELPYNYQWSTGETTRSIVVAQTGDYHVTVSTHTGCTINSNPIHIEVQPATIITQAPADTAVCSDASVQFLATASGTGVSYQWQLNGTDINDGSAYSGTQTNSLAISDASVPGPGLFRCVVTGVCGTDTSAEAALTFLAPPAKPVITPGGSLALCAGDTVTLTSSSATGNTWSNGATGTDIPVATPGAYNVFVIGTNGCKSPLSDTVTVMLNPLPSKPVIAAGGPVTFCEGSNVMLTSSASSGNMWSTGAASDHINVTASGSYTVQVTDANGCISPVSDAVTVTVNALPPKPVITSNGPTSFCQGGSVMLTSSASTGNTWSNGIAIRTLIVPVPGVFTVQVTDANGCVSPVSNAVTVNVHPIPAKPSITPSGPLEFCEGGNVTLTASPAAVYEWSTGSDASAITVNQSGTYTVQINENGCASPVSDAVLVQAFPVPSGTITANGPKADGGIRYMELIAPQLPGAQYKWLTGDEEPVIRVTKSGHYRVTVISGAGCYNNFGITVQLIDLTKIPNTFSPNRDGINDYWTIKEINLYANATVAVFNRSGMKVFEAKGSSIKWDGTSNGHDLPAGVYYYVLDLKDGGPPVNGWINLLK